MTSSERRAPLAAALPIAATAIFIGFVGLTLAIAGTTLGYDFLAYHAAAARLLDGQSPYDMSVGAVGGFGLFYYPPAFLPVILPFGVLDPTLATWAWTGLLLLAFGVGVAILPVPGSVKWWIVLLAGLSWPFAYSVKLGQVGPLLFLTFAAGWRWMDRPLVLGASTAIGTAIKIQPALLLGWSILTGRWRAAVFGVLFLVMLSIAGAAVAGVSSWTDFVSLMRQLADPIVADRNMSPGAVLYRLGVSTNVASAVQLANVVVVVVLVVIAAWRATAEASFLVAVTASQLLAPILWEHYAMLLLLPVAYLLSIGWRWAIVIPLASATLLTTVTPPFAYPIAFYATLIATLIAGGGPRPRFEQPRLRSPDAPSPGPDDGGRLWRGRRLGADLLVGRGGLRRVPRRLVLPGGRVPPRPDLARLRAGPNDVIIGSGGHFYVPFAPFPAIALMPLVAITGPVTADEIESGINAILAACTVGMGWWLLGRIGVQRVWDRVWLVALLGFSTQILWITTRGGVWHTGHLIATLLTLGCLIELWGKRRAWLIGLLAGAAFLTRAPLAFAVPFYALMLIPESAWSITDLRGLVGRAWAAIPWRSWAWLAAGVLPSIAFFFLYNQLRFDNPLESGYALATLPPWLEAQREQGLFSLAHVPMNLDYLFFHLPQLPFFTSEATSPAVYEPVLPPGRTRV